MKSLDFYFILWALLWVLATGEPGRLQQIQQIQQIHCPYTAAATATAGQGGFLQGLGLLPRPKRASIAGLEGR